MSADGVGAGTGAAGGAAGVFLTSGGEVNSWPIQEKNPITAPLLNDIVFFGF
jgi:hypothetical protein